LVLVAEALAGLEVELDAVVTTAEVARLTVGVVVVVVDSEVVDCEVTRWKNVEVKKKHDENRMTMIDPRELMLSVDVD